MEMPISKFSQEDLVDSSLKFYQSEDEPSVEYQDRQQQPARQPTEEGDVMLLGDGCSTLDQWHSSDEGDDEDEGGRGRLLKSNSGGRDLLFSLSSSQHTTEKSSGISEEDHGSNGRRGIVSRHSHGSSVKSTPEGNNVFDDYHKLDQQNRTVNQGDVKQSKSEATTVDRDTTFNSAISGFEPIPPSRPNIASHVVSSSAAMSSVVTHSASSQSSVTHQKSVTSTTSSPQLTTSTASHPSRKGGFMAHQPPRSTEALTSMMPSSARFLPMRPLASPTVRSTLMQSPKVSMASSNGRRQRASLLAKGAADSTTHSSSNALVTGGRISSLMWEANRGQVQMKPEMNMSLGGANCFVAKPIVTMAASPARISRTASPFRSVDRSVSDVLVGKMSSSSTMLLPRTTTSGSNFLSSTTSTAVDVSQLRVISERIEEREIRVPKRIIREDVIEKVIVIPEVVRQEEMAEDVVKVKNKIVEVAKSVIQERIVEVPEYVYVDKIVEVPERIVQEKIREVPRIEVQERVTEIPKIITQERLVEVPEIEYVEIPFETMVEIPEVHEKVVFREIPVPQYVDKPTPEYVDVEVSVEVVRQVPVPVEAVTTVELKLPKIRPRYSKVDVPLYVPRFVEIAVPVESLDAKAVQQCEHYVSWLQALAAHSAPSLADVERLGALLKDFKVENSMVENEAFIAEKLDMTSRDTAVDVSRLYGLTADHALQLTTSSSSVAHNTRYAIQSQHHGGFAVAPATGATLLRLDDPEPETIIFSRNGTEEQRTEASKKTATSSLSTTTTTEGRRIAVQSRSAASTFSKTSSVSSRIPPLSSSKTQLSELHTLQQSKNILLDRGMSGATTPLTGSSAQRSLSDCSPGLKTSTIKRHLSTGVSIDLASPPSELLATPVQPGRTPKTPTSSKRSHNTYQSSKNV